ncbi:MAG: 23S rRNA (guanosine(2251)-2'-O)-methyltransferase RlmB [Christensenella sp.]|nr:23S rRNA (guanosine(2251)-2'-O)-methyltransferase RlmB [Christensenella sp.]
MPQKQYGSGQGGQNKGSYRSGEKKGGYPKSGGYQGSKPYGQKAEGGYQGKKTYGDKPQGGYQGKKTYGDRPQGEGYQGNRSYGDRPQGSGYQGKKPFGDRPQSSGYQGNRPYSDRPQSAGYQGKRDFGDKPAGEGYQGNRPYGDRPQGSGYQGKKPYGDRPQGSGYQGKKPYGDKPYEKKPYEKKPYGERSFGDKPQGEGYQGKRDFGDRPQGGYQGNRPYEKKPYHKTSAYDDHRAEEMRLRDRLAEDEPNAQEQDELPFLILGRNAVKEAIKSERSIDRIEVVGEPDGSLREILGLARERKLVIREVDKRHLDEICLPFGHGGKPGNHQGIVAYAAGVEYCTVADILAVAREKNEDPFVVVLDGILDPHNLGSIIRSAECAGAHGVIIGKRRSASVTAATVKASAGATEHVKIARVVNIPAALDELKRAKLWVAGADMKGQPMTKQGLNGPLALVIGGEGDGISKLVSEKCDFLVSIPQYGQIGSLNAGVAAGILMFEKKRQDKAE